MQWSAIINPDVVACYTHVIKFIAGVFLIINSTHVIYINHSYRTHIEGPHTMICSGAQLLIQMLYQTSLLYPREKIYSRCIPDM